MPQANAAQQAYELLWTFKPINVVLTAAFLVFALYKMLSHPGGAVRGLNAAFEAVVLLLVRMVGFVSELVLDLLGKMERDLTMLA
jgi:hypothetical protein